MKRSKIVSLLLCVCFFCSVVIFTCGTGSCKTVKSGSRGNNVIANGPFAGIEPLDHKVTLKIGVLTGSMHGFGSYLIEKLGGYKAANIKPSFVSFANGPIMVEAVVSNSWDCGAYGMGGTLAGTIGQGVINLGACSRDYHPTQIFARKDSAIVKAGLNVKGYKQLYGTAQTWKGAKVYLPVGTTLHYLLIEGLEKFNLSIDDVVLTNMDVSNVNAALRAGKVEVGGLWSNFPYGDINKTCQPVMTTADLGIELVSAYVANPRSLANQEKKQAIKKWLELYFAAVNWINASNENFKQVIKWYIDWNESEGITTTEKEATDQWTYCGHYTLDENYKMLAAVKNTKDGKMNMFQYYNYAPLKFYIQNGNYKKSAVSIFNNPKYMYTAFVNDLYRKAHK